jgi:type III restriction enzyme
VGPRRLQLERGEPSEGSAQSRPAGHLRGRGHLNRHVNAIAGRLSLRPPQRRALEILDRITEIALPKKGMDAAAALDAIKSEFKSVADFERDFPSLCFALATGVGKTRLMGAFISYLHLAHGHDNFFVLAPNLTIYNKLIADFTPNTPKYVFTGIAEFATGAPAIITGENYESQASTLFDVVRRCKINIFNISKINTEVRGGKSPRIKRLSEYIGESYFDYLAALPDLVLIMDESHRYRASAGVKAINELKPVLGLELTATPFTESAKGPVPFKNVILNYPLGRAMEDGFVKEPAVVTRKNFNPAGMAPEQIELMKLEDGVRLHESTKVELKTWALGNDVRVVKPFLLVIARDTTHAAELLARIQSDGFFDGYYKERVIQVDSSRTGAEEEEMIARLLRVEDPDEPTEIVIHVNMLKEGWDVTNLYTIVPLRPANARTLIEQSIGRGLRLPYGKRTGVTAVDRLNIVAHDRFQEIVEEANKPDSIIRIQAVELDPEQLARKPVTVTTRSVLDDKLGLQLDTAAPATGAAALASVFTTQGERDVARVAYGVIRKMARQHDVVPTVSYLAKPEIQQAIVTRVREEMKTAQFGLGALAEPTDLEKIIATEVAIVIEQTISIPQIVVVPKGEVKSGYRAFKLKLDSLRYPAVSEELRAQYLRTGAIEDIAIGNTGAREPRPENYVVAGLVDFNDVSYDNHADMLYGLASQVVAHFRTYLSEEETGEVLACYQKPIAKFVHAQMQEHFEEDPAEHEVKITEGFTEIRASVFAADVAGALDFRHPPADKNSIASCIFTGFNRCLVNPVKFQSDTERKLAVILDRESLKWFKPAKGQFQIYYRRGAEQPEYIPDFAAETAACCWMLEPKARGEMEGPDVQAKQAAAVVWCGHASTYNTKHGEKRWRYALIPHDVIAENMTLDALVKQYATK